MKQIVLTFLVSVALAAGATVGCAKARHVAVQIDSTVSTVVFALDDAELAACQTHALTQEQCDRLGPMIVSALKDVKTATAAIQAVPKNGQVPQSLPALIQTLRSVQMIALALPPSQVTDGLVAKTNTALDAAIALLSKIAGA